MTNTIFYSWQSDLPNKSNRTFIESCLKQVVKDVSKVSPFSIDLTIDRDTKNKAGTPDISETIFKKIQSCKIFVADISIINSTCDGKKVPNPNVLLELGYAIRVLGWDRIVCFYNLDYGTLSELPFDLRGKRIMSYSLSSESKATVRKQLSKDISESILRLQKSGNLDNVVDNYVKMKIDTEILTITNFLSKILFGYSEDDGLKRTFRMLNLKDENFIDLFQEREFIGFQIFKRLKVQEENLMRIVDNMISSVHQNKELAAPVIEIIGCAGRYNALTSLRNDPGFFRELGIEREGYKVAPGNSQELPDRLLLLKHIKDDKFVVADFGDFQERSRKEKLLNVYSFNQEHLKMYSSLFLDFIKAINSWLDITNGEFLLDTYHHFEFRPPRKQNG